MTEQEIYIDRYDWTVHVMYDVHSKDAMKVRRHLRDLGCSGIPLEDACNLVLEGEPNKGITYSNVIVSLHQLNIQAYEEENYRLYYRGTCLHHH